MRRSAICYTIGDMEDGIVLGQFLKAKGFSHRLAVRIKAAQGLAVDGIAAYAGYRLKTGQTVEAVSYTHLDVYKRQVPEPPGLHW